MPTLTSKQKELREKLDAYLINNPIEKGKPGCYSKVADLFKIDSEYVRNRYRKLSERGLVKKVDEKVLERAFKEDIKSGEAELTQVVNKRIKTLDDLIEVCEIDTKVWEIVSYEVNKWEVGRKDRMVHWTSVDGQGTGTSHDSGKINVEPLFQVKAKLSRRRLDKDLFLQKEAVMAELRAYTPSLIDREKFLKNYGIAAREFKNGKKDCALEINIPDLHIGKLSWGEETGDDYDLKIAVERYKNAIAQLLGRTDITSVERFILVVGHDFLNVDGKNNLTTAGTPQSSDSRFYKMVKIGKELLIETIDYLSVITDVDVIVVPGNHDSNSMLMMGDILEAFYHKSKNVKVFNGAASRKYYQYGNTGIMYVHGHNERLDDLGMIFATENKEMWANTDFHRVHLGHFHHQKQLKYKDIEEKIGCTVKIISSLSSNDAWHSEKGYLSLKGAEAFLYHKEKGLLANYYYYI